MFPTVIKRFRIPNFQSPVFIIMVVGTLLAMGQPASAKINWDNPCDYLHRNRTTREIRTRELTNEVRKAVQDFKKLETSINAIYHNKLKFCDKRPPKGNRTLGKFYKEFRKFGPQVEKLLEKKIISHDGMFPESLRISFLSQIGNRTKSILCELDDVLNLKRRRGRRGRNPSRARRSAENRGNLTSTIVEDRCAYAAYKKLIHSLKLFLSESRRADHHSEKLSKRGAASTKRRQSEEIATRRRNRRKRRKLRLKKPVI